MSNLNKGVLGRQNSNLISLEPGVLPLQHPSLSFQLALQKYKMTNSSKNK
jgi:hypothetical protein